MEICLACSQQDHPIYDYEDEPTDKSKLWGDLEEEEEQEEEMDEEELEDGMESVDTLSRSIGREKIKFLFQKQMSLGRKANQVDLLRGAKDRWISVYWRPWRMFYLPSK
ncbi:hypothetical protein HID58_012437 [Brassica napus]|uniref:Uncharacterized protein n=1 Tax=Brassica napus TaxID=3708 RepID=A0ABQ8E3N0_BRANA|nr:hypothetical protein HID58_012437 [Brassica napus]